MKIESSFVVPAPQAKVWSVLNDIGIVSSCIPGCESIERISDVAYRGVVKAEIGVIKARFNLLIEVTRTEPPNALFFTSRGEEGSRASILQSENSVVLEATSDQATRVSVTSDVAVTGRLGKFGLGVMKKKSESMTREFAESLQAKVGEPGKLVAASLIRSEREVVASSLPVADEHRPAAPSPMPDLTRPAASVPSAPVGVEPLVASTLPANEGVPAASIGWARLNQSLRRHPWWTRLSRLFRRR